MEDFKKNGEKYTDPTMRDAITGIIEPGEVRKYNDKFVLVLRNQGFFCNIVILFEEMKAESMRISFKDKTMYTNPAMISYAHNKYLGPLVSVVEDDVFDKVLRKVKQSLGFCEGDGKPLQRFGEEEGMKEEPKEERTIIDPTEEIYKIQLENANLKGRNELYHELIQELFDRL